MKFIAVTSTMMECHIKFTVRNKLYKATKSMTGGSIPTRDRKFHLFINASRQALDSTQSPSQWISGTLSPEVKQREREAEFTFI
jgi:hypothetical protein